MFSRICFALLVALPTCTYAQRELDLESTIVNSKGVNPSEKTVILRVDTRDNSLSMAAIENVKSQEQAEAVALNEGAFQAINKDEVVRSELDRDGGTSSWFFFIPAMFWLAHRAFHYYPNYYYPSYYYYGYNYRPYYYYNYGYYNYYYYGYRYW